MKEIGHFALRLTSRKFLVTIAGIFAVTLFPELKGEIVTLIITFVGAEGVADTVSRYAVEQTNRKAAEIKAEQLELGNDDPIVDKTQVVAGDYAL